MAIAFIPAIVVPAIWFWFWGVADTFPSSAWAMRDLEKSSSTTTTTTNFAVAIQSENSASAHFNAQPSRIHGARRRLPVELNKLVPANCSPQDISITQHQVAGKGIPRFEVSIANTCINHGCSIRSIVAFCGQFTSASPIDPNVFRRDGAGPYCIVNNLNPMASGQMLTFHYDTEFIEPIRLASASVICSQ